jgi:pimeloyl-ACP methyl ester carboxylesterase
VAQAEVNGHQLYYERRGSGEPLLLIQGMTGNHLHWGEPFLSRIEPHFDTTIFDHRGIGRSGPVTAPFTIADLADDAVALLDVMGIDQAHVMGISMGGMAAQELALRHPERVRTLVLGCTTAGGPDSTPTDPAVVARLGELLMSGRIGEVFAEGLKFNVSAEFAADDGNIEAFRRIATELPMELPIMLAQFQAVTGHDTSARLGDIAAPTLILHGSEDRILPVANAHHIARLMPGAQLEIFDGVGHLFWWERPEPSAELVREHAAAGAAAAQ